MDDRRSLPRARRSGPKWLDRLAIGASALCLVHCLALPLLVVALPSLGWFADDERTHWLLLAFALPIGLYALGRARGLAGWEPLIVGAAGLTLMAAGVALFAKSPFERWATVIGVTLVAAGHLLKWRANHRGHAHA